VEFNIEVIEVRVFDRHLLPRKLIHPRLSNLASAIGAAIVPTIGTGARHQVSPLSE
jgi:hypothetical protein